MFQKGNIPVNKGKKGSPTPGSWKKGHIPWDKGKKLSTETREKIGAALRGRRFPGSHPRSEEHRRKISIAKKGKSLEQLVGIEAAGRIRRHTSQLGKQISVLNREARLARLAILNKDPEFQHKRLMSMNLRPNKYEQRVMQAIEQYQLPYKFVGDGSVILNNLNPDFINCNGKKVIVEVFGEVFHDPQKTFRKSIRESNTEEGRRKRFNEIGFRMMVLWASELKKMSLVNIAQRITDFEKGGE